MSISAIQSGQSIYGAASAQQRANTATEASTNRKTTTDSVNISDEARAKESAALDAREDRSKGLRVPRWLVDLSPKVFSLPSSIEEANKHNKINAGKPNSSPDTAQPEIKEYNQMVYKAFQEEGTKMDVWGLDLIKNKDISEKLHQAVRGRLTAEPRASELMKLMEDIGQIEATS